MNVDHFVILMTWIVSLITCFWVVPRSRVREFIAVFMFFQTLTWIFSIVLTQFGHLKADIRLFDKATKINFTSEFMFYPTMAMVFHRFFPNKGGKIRIALHYMLMVGVVLLYLYSLGTFTNIMTFKFTQIIRSFFNFTFEFWLTRRYIKWLMKNTTLQKSDEVREA